MMAATRWTARLDGTVLVTNKPGLPVHNVHYGRDPPKGDHSEPAVVEIYAGAKTRSRARPVEPMGAAEVGQGSTWRMLLASSR
jgi:hypothetical protein